MTSSFITLTRCAPLLVFPSSCTRDSARASLQQTTISLAVGNEGVSAVCFSESSAGPRKGDVKLKDETLLESGRDVEEREGSEDGEQSWSRRGLMGTGLAVVASWVSLSCEPAHAFSLGISGPKDWLKGQKRKTAQFLLNPIEASRDRLSSAMLLLSSAEGSSVENYEEAGKLVKVASRDCTPVESGSILDLQTRSGVEVCTFKLVLKNAASLLAKDDPVKLSATAALDDLIRSFVTVDGLLTNGGTSSATQREDVMGALKQTMVALDNFQQGVQNCLDA